MAIADDFTVATNGDIRHTSGTTNYTVLEMHRFLQQLLDNQQAVSASSDFADITTLTLSDRKTDEIIELLNGANIDDTAAEFLYGGSILNTDLTLYSGLKVLGAVNNSATQLQVVQDHALYEAGVPFWGTQATGGYNGDAATGVLMRCLIKTSLAGVDIDNRDVRVQARHWGDTYDFFKVTLGTAEAVAAIGTTPDAQNGSVQGTVTTYTHVVNTNGTANAPIGGHEAIDLLNGNGSFDYYSKWTYGADTSGDGLKGVYEYLKDLTGDGTAKTCDNIAGDLFIGITHSVAFSAQTGSFTEGEILDWGTGPSLGQGRLLALSGTNGFFYIQLLTGVAPNANTITGATSTFTATAGTVLIKTLPKIFVGSYTGSLIGAFGIGVEPNDLTSLDTVEPLIGAVQQPPNNVTFTVSGLTSGQDQLLIGEKDTGDDFKFLQLTSSAVETTNIVAGAFLMSGPIPTDTPASGTIRVHLANGIYARVAYTSYTGSTFTITHDFTVSNSNADKAVMVSYIDKTAGAASEAFTTIFLAPRTLWIRRRYGGVAGDGPTKTADTQATLSSTGGSIIAARLLDA